MKCDAGRTQKVDRPPLNGRRHGLALLLETGESPWLTVRGESMAPFLRGDGTAQVQVEATAPVQIRPGDIVVFDRDGSWVCHRIVGVSGRGRRLTFVEKGDGAWSAGKLAPANIIGRVRRVKVRGRVLDLDLAQQRSRRVARLLAHIGGAAAAAAEIPLSYGLANVPVLGALLRAAGRLVRRLTDYRATHQ